MNCDGFIIDVVFLLLCCAEMCGQCYDEHMQAKYLAQMFYENATIYISKVAEVDRTIAHTGDSTAPTLTTGLNASSTAFNNTLTSEDYISVTDEQVSLAANDLLLHLPACVNIFRSDKRK